MALDHYSVSINGVTPVLLAHAPQRVGNRKTKIYVANTGANDIYIGDNTVTSTDGYLLVKAVGQTVGYRQEFELFGGETLYVICAPATTSTAAVIVSGL